MKCKENDEVVLLGSDGKSAGAEGIISAVPDEVYTDYIVLITKSGTFCDSGVDIHAISDSEYSVDPEYIELKVQLTLETEDMFRDIIRDI